MRQIKEAQISFPARAGAVAPLKSRLGAEAAIFDANKYPPAFTGKRRQKG